MFFQTADRAVYRLTNSLTSAARTLSDRWRRFFYKYMFSIFDLKEISKCLQTDLSISTLKELSFSFRYKSQRL